MSFALTRLCVGLFVGHVTPSTSCGPFRNVTLFDDVATISRDGVGGSHIVYDYIINLIESSDESLKNVRKSSLFPFQFV